MIFGYRPSYKDAILLVEHCSCGVGLRILQTMTSTPNHNTRTELPVKQAAVDDEPELRVTPPNDESRPLSPVNICTRRQVRVCSLGGWSVSFSHIVFAYIM